MSSSTSKVDYFGTFLGSVGGTPKESAPASDATVEQKLLSALAAAQSPIPVKSLLYVPGMSPSLVMNALNELQAAKLVEVRAINGDDQAEMTDLGRRLAS
jgi:predicted transcriptional regulator